jgi:Diacylglycerol kinase catalytic domain
MTETSILWLVANSASGSNDDNALAELIERLRATGNDPARVIDCSSEALPGRTELDQAGVATLAVFTGDGTISALLPPLEGWDGHVLVLPGGTTNLLAKMLHEPCDLAAIVAAFATGQARPERRSCVRWSGHTAMCEVLAGPGAKWSDVREGLRERDFATVTSTALDAVKESAGGAMVQIAEPTLGHEAGYAGVRIVPHETGLAVSGYRADGVSGYLKQGLALLQRDFREGPHDELGMHRELLCRAADGSPIELMIDGERAVGESEERFSLATLALDLLATGHG